MRFVQSVGEHIILARVPVYTSIVLCYWVPEISAHELAKAARAAFQLMNWCLIRASRSPVTSVYDLWLSML